MELVYKEVHNIYSGKHNPQRFFLKSLVNSDVFNVLNNDEEFAIRELQEKMEETNSASVRVDISDEICKALNSKGYIGSYSVDKENRIIDCRFILYYYFELKSRLQN